MYFNLCLQFMLNEFSFRMSILNYMFIAFNNKYSIYKNERKTKRKPRRGHFNLKFDIICNK